MSISYALFETGEYRECLSRIARSEGGWFTGKLTMQAYSQLKKEPHFGPNIARMKAFKPSTWRFRVGTYRLFYHIDEAKKIVFLDSIKHRKEAYRNL